MPKPRAEKVMSLIRLSDSASETELDALYEQMWAEEARDLNSRWES